MNDWVRGPAGRLRATAVGRGGTPLLLIHGNGYAEPLVDVLLPAQVPEVPRRAMAGVSHWLMMDRPEEFNAYVAEFLAGVSG